MKLFLDQTLQNNASFYVLLLHWQFLKNNYDIFNCSS